MHRRAPHMKRLLLTIGTGLVLGLLLTASPGCMQSPRDKLIGRWYNSRMSIRFREDGSVLFNSAAGRADGVYYFDERRRSVNANSPSPNLTLDVIRNNQRIVLQYEIEIMSHDRLRLSLINTEGSRNRPRMDNAPLSFTILKRAKPEEESVASR
jgi:hypothetical protein